MSKRRNLIRKRRGRSVCAVATTLVAAAVAFPAAAAAGSYGDGWPAPEPVEEGVVVESPAPSPEGPWAHWSKERLEQAEPMPLVTLPEPAAPPAPETPSTTSSESAGTPSSEGASAPSSEGASTAGLRAATGSRVAAVEGVEVAASESTVLPSSANGKLFGTYYIHVGPREFEKEDYVCSAAVVSSPAGNVILTAGHCAIEPKTGTPTSTELIFIPGFRNGTAPFGSWKIGFGSIFITESWKNTAKAESRPNEGADLAFIRLNDNAQGESVEEAVGSLGVAFDKPCNQTYTQFGYPAETPYGGELLYSHSAAYAGADTNAGFTPVPLKIGSDFTRGASGGPWAVGVGSGQPPAILSLTAYGYENQPGYLYGPYFGEAAKKSYGAAIGRTIPAGIEETCAALPQPPTPPQPPPTTPETPTPTPAPEASPEQSPVRVKLTRVRRLTNGSAVLTAKVNTAGMLKLSGATVRAESLDTPAAGKYRMVVAAKGATNRKLRQVGRAKVGVRVAFLASGKTARVSKKIQLSRRSAARPAQRSG